LSTMQVPEVGKWMTIRAGIELGNITDVGCRRARNEDYYCYSESDDEDTFRRKGRLLIVADGVGSHAGGEVASQLAVESVRDCYLASRADLPAAAALAEAFEAAHFAIQDFAHQHQDLVGMATTCTAAALVGGHLSYAHVGDSRLYIVRRSQIAPLTEDHTIVNRLVKQGVLSLEAAATSPERGVLTAALGAGESVAIEVSETPIPLESGDTLLMCTDGLYDLVDDLELAAIVTASSPGAACRELVELAKSRGGFDNMTVQVLVLEKASA